MKRMLKPSRSATERSWLIGKLYDVNELYAWCLRSPHLVSCSWCC